MPKDPKFFSVPEKPLTNDEINKRMQSMMEERARQDEEILRHWQASSVARLQPITEAPMTKEEIARRVNEMAQERARQDAKAKDSYSQRNHPSSLGCCVM